MTLKGLTKAQRAFLTNMYRQIMRCEKEIPMQYWCTSCRSRFRRIVELTKRFHRIREKAETVLNQFRLIIIEQSDMTDGYWQNRTDIPQFNSGLWKLE